MIKSDLQAAVQFFYNKQGQHFDLLNSAHIVLIPKKDDARALSDFRPISLTSSVAKLISKLLASRLSKLLYQLVSRCQSAFIKKRSIHDNFLYAQNLSRELHQAKKTGTPQAGYC